MFLSPSIGRRLLTGCAAAFLSIAMVACSDQNTNQPTAPEGLNPGAPLMDVAPLTCPAQADIDAAITGLIKALYGPPQPSKTLSAQLGKYSTFKSKLPSKPSDALKKMIELDQSVLVDLSQRKVNGIPSPAEENVAKLIYYLGCYYNYFNGTAPDITVGVYVPGGTTSSTFLSPSGVAGTLIPPNAYPEPLLITVEDLADGSNPLLTDLDQYPKFARFHAEPVDGTPANGDPPEDQVVTFFNDVIVSLCTVTNTVPSGSLRLAHNIAPFNFGDIEIWPVSTTSAGVNCAGVALNSDPSEPASWLLGRTLMARMKGATSVLSPVARFLLPEAANAALVVGVTSGAGSRYSPFGAVDTRIELVKQTPDPQNALSNSTITEGILARRVSDHTTPLRALPVTLVPSAGTTVPDSSIVTSSATGLFGTAFTDWNLNGPGTSTLTFKVQPAAKVPTGFPTTDATFTAIVTDNTPPPPGSGALSFVQQPSNTCVNTSISPAVTVQTTDPTEGVPVTLQAISSNGSKKTLSGGGPLPTGSDGKVAFPNLSLDGPGGFNLVASAPGWTSATSTRFNVSPTCPP